MSKTFFTSDLHFGHRGILKHCSRPFESVEEMDEGLISRWNESVSTEDTIYVLGDLSFYGLAKTVAIVKRLNGKKHWITGNHDKALMGKDEIRALFESVTAYKEIKVQIVGQDTASVVMCHYPMLTWNKAHYGSWMLHGHCHGTLKHPHEGMRLKDVGADTNDLKPYSVDEINEWMQGRIYNEVDHHTTKENQ
jgi:calcineurin-like phosphoesterase family protein